MTTFKLGNKYLSRDVYNSFIDQTHFLVQLDRVFDWHELAAPLADLARTLPAVGLGIPRS